MLTGVVVFLLLFIALLAIPLTVIFQVSWRQRFQSDIKLLWLFGIVRIRLSAMQTQRGASEGEKLVEKNISLRSARNTKNVSGIMMHKAFRRRMIRFIRDLWGSVHKHNISLRMRIGLGDPADTGQLWAIVGPVAGMLGNVKDAAFEFEPEFIETTFELHSSGKIRLVPIQVIILIFQLLLSPSVWRAREQMRRVGVK